MKKKIYSNLILMMCAVFLFAGCAANGNTGETQQEVQETEHKSEVRSAFVEEKVTETTEPEEALQPEDDTSATADGRGEFRHRHQGRVCRGFQEYPEIYGRICGQDL